MHRLLILFVFLLPCACIMKQDKPPAVTDLHTVDIGLAEGYTAHVVASGLKNPSYVTFHPHSSALTIVDSGNGRVLKVVDGVQWPILTGLATEWWKVYKNSEGQEISAYRVGPLAAHWLRGDQLVVTDAGRPDGEEALITFQISSKGEAPKVIARTNTVGPTTADPVDLGEGNLSGLTVLPDNDTYYVCGQGFDGKSWVLGGSLKSGTLKPLFSADDHGITVNSPMQALVWRGKVLVVYSGAGGKDDGLLVEWDPETRTPVNQWPLPGLADPMCIAQVPGQDDQFAITANNWALEGVNHGKIALVTLGAEGAVETDVIADRIFGPVHCAFGPDGRLYVTSLGTQLDSDKGEVIAIAGFEAIKG